jgi:hypothetical protein
MTVVRIVHQLARTGGTLLNRCLGSMDGVNALSEVHPRQGCDKALKQAARWFSLVGVLDVPWALALHLRPRDQAFVRAILRLSARAEARGKYLVVRDWTHLDFVGVPFVKEPPLRLTTAELLGRHATLRQAFMTRHPLDQYLSSRKRKAMALELRPEPYLAACLRFATIAQEHGFQRYEDLVVNPERTVAEICARLDVPFNADFRRRWSSYTTVTGDKYGSTSRAFHLDEFVALPRYECEPELLQTFRDNPDYWRILELLGYEDLAG